MRKVNLKIIKNIEVYPICCPILLLALGIHLNLENFHENFLKLFSSCPSQNHN